MKRWGILLILSNLFLNSFSQSVAQKIQAAYKKFDNDEQLKHAISSLYIIDAETGKVVFDKNSQIGLVPASTQKVITSVTAYELLGENYQFKTELAYDGYIDNTILKGNLYVLGYGDPTLGSFRWQQTNPEKTLQKWVDEIKKTGIKRVDGYVKTNTSNFSHQAIPDGWIWQDIGNYYGAGAYALNWKENQYELFLDSENKLGGAVKIKRNGYEEDYWINELKAAEKSSGDNAYVYFDRYINGTIPMGAKNFKITASDSDPIKLLLSDFNMALSSEGISSSSSFSSGYVRELYERDKDSFSRLNKIYTHYSYPLDSIIYWFNRKSVNLYGEALVKAFSLEKNKFASTNDGVTLLKNFWKQKGLDEGELKIEDGSGLSPQNRVTTHAQVEILKFAKGRKWFTGFYHSLPTYNSMKMKSGTIGGVKGFTGYHTSKEGKEYIFSFLVNNYSGSVSSLVRKMYLVLDELK